MMGAIGTSSIRLLDAGRQVGSCSSWLAVAVIMFLQWHHWYRDPRLRST